MRNSVITTKLCHPLLDNQYQKTKKQKQKKKKTIMEGMIFINSHH